MDSRSGLWRRVREGKITINKKEVEQPRFFFLKKVITAHYYKNETNYVITQE